MLACPSLGSTSWLWILLAHVRRRSLLQPFPSRHGALAKESAVKIASQVLKCLGFREPFGKPRWLLGDLGCFFLFFFFFWGGGGGRVQTRIESRLNGVARSSSGARYCIQDSTCCGTQREANQRGGLLLRWHSVFQPHSESRSGGLLVEGLGGGIPSMG